MTTLVRRMFPVGRASSRTVRSAFTLLRLGCGLVTTAALGAAGCGMEQLPSPAAEEAPIAALHGAVGSGSKFGALCQRDFQSSWQDTLPYSYNRCEGFTDELSSTDSLSFYYNLKGKKPFIETANDQDLAETVDLLFLSTHGGASGDSARYVMFEKDTRAFTKNMYLGNESRRLSILSGYACDTMKGTDKELIARWKPAYAGGLRYVTGAWDVLWDGITTDEVGEDYADNLQDGMAIQDAWSDAVSDWATEQHPAIQATGATWNDCLARKNNMKWNNYGSYPRLQDSAVKYYCGHRWTN